MNDDEHTHFSITPSPRTNTPSSPYQAPKQSVLRTLIRLGIGGIVEGGDELARRLKQWEETAIVEAHNKPLPLDESSRDRLRYALIGYLFEKETQVSRRLSAFRWVGRGAKKAISLAFRPLTHSNRLDRYESWIARGEAEVARWIALGRVEEQYSRSVIRQAVGGSFDEIIDQVAGNPQLEEMVHQQSINLATEVVEEARERMVSADTLLERVVRSLLRFPPREALPEPPQVVQDRVGLDYLGKTRKKERK